ncbi:hypothetical protein ACN47E_008397 [Coniothyrium glycines]
MATKNTAQRQSHESLCSTLPPEIWINIFSYHTDLAHLWLTCRRVSPTLRACAEHAFGENFLQDVRIDFQLEKYNLGGKSQRPEINVVFDRVGKGREKEIAWYRCTQEPSLKGRGPGKKAQAHHDKMMSRWEENVKAYKPEMPNYTISIGDLVNDTELPDLKIDIDKREVCFRWKEMLSLFFRERCRLLFLKTIWQVETSKKMEENNARLKKGEKLMPSDYPCSWSSAKDEMRKEIRRWRLKESYHDDEQMVWALGSLKYFENYGGSANGSSKALRLNPDLPGAGLGEQWFGSTNLVQELYLDEWSCMHRIDTKIDHIRSGE